MDAAGQNVALHKENAKLAFELTVSDGSLAATDSVQITVATAVAARQQALETTLAADAFVVDLDVSYGLVQASELTRLQPFAQVGMVDGVAQRLRLGLRLERSDGLEMEQFKLRLPLLAPNHTCPGSDRSETF